jgi:hypothetical protein
MATVLRLLQGDKRNPTRVLDFTQAGGKIRLAAGGFAPAPGKQTVLWSGQTLRSDGQQRLDSSRDNAELTLTYNLVEGGSAAELDWLQRQIDRFFFEAGLYEEKREGEPVWLEYCWPDGLEDLPAPSIGQLRRYPRVLQGEPVWPRNVHTWLRAGAIEGIVANLVCGPVADGLKQKGLNASGQTEMTSRGVVVPRAVTNLCTNPCFGNSTWNYGWAASNAALKMTQETRTGFTRSLNSAARLSNTSGTAYDFTQTQTLTANTHYVSCYVRKLDGSPVTSGDVQIVIQGSPQTTLFERIDGGPWYLAYASATAAASSSTHGVQVKASKTVIVDDVQIENAGPGGSNRNGSHPLWHCAGHKLGCSWSGTPHASTSTRGGGRLAATVGDELATQYAVAFWITPFWDTGPSGASPDYLRLLQYYYDGNNGINVVHWLNGTLAAIHRVDGTSYQASDVYGTLDFGSNYHIAITNDGSTLRIYVNGSEFTTVASPAYQPAGGTLALGCDESSLGYESEAAIDGLHVWKHALSATEVKALYDSEKPIKDDYGAIGMPPFAWTKGGDGVLDACDDTNRDNYMVIGGIGGDMVEAIAEWQIDPKTTTPPDVYWIGRKTSEEIFDPASTFWLEFQGTADANSSGGQYEQHAFAGVGTYDFDVAVDEIKHLQGRVHFLARLYVSGNAVDVNPFYRFGSGPRIDGEVHTIPTNANFLLRAYPDWDMWIRWDHLREGETPASLTLGLHVSDPTGGGSVRCDFIQVLPYPNVRIEVGNGISLAAGDTLHIIQDEAYLLASSGAEKYSPEFRGEPVNLLPGKYNYVWFLPGEEGQQYDITDYATFVVYVTPRWVLPGGPVA